MDFIRKYLVAIVAFFVGLALGLFWAWVVSPTEWTGTPPDTLAPEYKGRYIETTAVAFAQSNNPVVVQNAFGGWTDPATDICNAAAGLTDPATINVYNQMAAVFNGQGCAPAGAGEPLPGVQEPVPPETGGANSTVVLGLLLLLIFLAILVVVVLRRRRSLLEDEEPSTYYDMPDTAPVSEEEGSATPLARFPSNYTYGRDNFDDSHSIESANGDFLGECGIGIAESIGSGSPKNVTAFEVWLFDKNDIRTVTKVIMSDHAFFDDAIKAKLAPKGEPVLARENEVIVLETAALIINAQIREMAYGESASLPPQSYFESFTIELSAWAKEGSIVEPDIEGRVDELLEY